MVGGWGQATLEVLMALNYHCRVFLSPLTSERQSAFYSSLSPVQSKSLGAQRAFNKFVCATLSQDVGERPLALPIPLTPVASLTEALGNG